MVHHIKSFLETQAVIISGRDSKLDEIRRRQEIDRLAQFPALNPLPVIEIDHKGQVTYLNPAGRKLLQELNGDETDVDLILSREYIDKAIECLQSGTQVHSKEVQLNGSVFLWTGKTVPLKVVAGACCAQSIKF